MYLRIYQVEVSSILLVEVRQCKPKELWNILSKWRRYTSLILTDVYNIEKENENGVATPLKTEILNANYSNENNYLTPILFLFIFL